MIAELHRRGKAKGSVPPRPRVPAGSTCGTAGICRAQSPPAVVSPQRLPDEPVASGLAANVIAYGSCTELANQLGHSWLYPQLEFGLCVFAAPEICEAAESMSSSAHQERRKGVSDSLRWEPISRQRTRWTVPIPGCVARPLNSAMAPYGETRLLRIRASYPLSPLCTTKTQHARIALSTPLAIPTTASVSTALTPLPLRNIS